MRLQFILSEIGQGLRRDLSMTVSVVLVTFVSLTFVGSAALLQAQIGKMKDDWYDKVEVSVFLCPQNSSEPTCVGEVTDDSGPTSSRVDAPETRTSRPCTRRRRSRRSPRSRSSSPTSSGRPRRPPTT